MANLDPRKNTRRTTAYIEDLPRMIETLKFRLRLKLQSLAQGKPQPESREQLEWGLGLCDQVLHSHQKRLAWPAGSLSWVMGTTWPAESDLREEFLRLEKAYPVALSK